MDSINNDTNWNDNDFKKKINEKKFCEDNRLRIMAEDPTLGICSWCGKPFIKQHHSEKYCNDKCRDDARGQQSRNKAHKWYHKHKKELSEKSRWGLGSGTLGGHRHDDFQKEQSVIQKEFTRLRLKRR